MSHYNYNVISGSDEPTKVWNCIKDIGSISIGPSLEMQKRELIVDWIRTLSEVYDQHAISLFTCDNCNFSFMIFIGMEVCRKKDSEKCNT